MDYSFDHPIERRGTASFKWDLHGGDLLPLWVADMDFASPPQVVEALESRAAHCVYGYSLVPDSLVEAIVRHLDRRYGWRIDGDWLVWLPSVVPGLNLACDAFCAPDEAVLTITPVYPPFLEAPPQRGRRLATVPAEEHDGHWELPLDGLEAAVGPDTRVLFFCHPHNPLGRVWRREEVVAVVDFCRRHDLVLVSDEIHCDLVLDAIEHVPAGLACPGDADRIVTLMSPSKTFNLPGLNFAFAVVADTALRRRFLAPGQDLEYALGYGLLNPGPGGQEQGIDQGPGWARDAGPGRRLGPGCPEELLHLRGYRRFKAGLHLSRQAGGRVRQPAHPDPHGRGLPLVGHRPGDVPEVPGSQTFAHPPALVLGLGPVQEALLLQIG